MKIKRNLRRLLQFRLRTLLVVMLAACGLMAWRHYHLKSYHQQWRAYQKVADKAVYTAVTTGRPAWLRPLADRRFQDVTRLSFHRSSSLTDADLVHLTEMPRLERLSLHGTQITDRGLVHLSKLTNLKVLSLNHTQITDKGLAHLRGLRNLKQLQLRQTRITAKAAHLLRNHPHLEHLELGKLPLQDEDLTRIGALRNLKHLRFSAPITAKGFQHLVRLKNLETLMLDSQRLERVVMSDMPKLSVLKLGLYNRRSVAVVRLSNLKSLNEVSIRSTFRGRRLSDISISDSPQLKTLLLSPRVIRRLHLKNLPKLVELNLTRAHLHELQLSGLDNVQNLNLYRAVLTDSLIQQAAQLPNLRNVLMRFARPDKIRAPRRSRPITSDDLAFLRNKTNLKSIHLSGTHLANDALSVLANAKELEELLVNRCRLTDAALPPLACLRNLRFLDLSNNPISGKGLAHLAALNSLERLYLPNTSINDEGLAHLHCLSNLELVSLPPAPRTSNRARAKLQASLPGALVYPPSLAAPLRIQTSAPLR